MHRDSARRSYSQTTKNCGKPLVGLVYWRPWAGIQSKAAAWL